MVSGNCFELFVSNIGFVLFLTKCVDLLLLMLVCLKKVFETCVCVYEQDE